MGLMGPSVGLTVGLGPGSSWPCLQATQPPGPVVGVGFGFGVGVDLGLAGSSKFFLQFQQLPGGGVSTGTGVALFAADVGADVRALLWAPALGIVDEPEHAVSASEDAAHAIATLSQKQRIDPFSKVGTPHHPVARLADIV
jgi:hypothetical protein